MKLSFITDEVTQNFDEAVQFAKQYGLSGLELRSVNDTPIDAIALPQVQAIFDPGNCLYDPLGEVPFPDGYLAIRPYFAHVHIKDAVRSNDGAECVKVGTGQVNFAALLPQLAADGYDGWLSMETHYRTGGQLSEDSLRLPGGADFSVGGAGATAESVLALKEILQKEVLL